MKRIRTLPAIALLTGFLAAPAAFAQNNAEQRGIIDCGVQYATCIITKNIFTCSAELALCLLGSGGGNGSAAMERRD
ncbi:hypothetical protein H9654_07500 [Stenotrophomonas sp. Sa5BUN4]|uniref:DUF3551 domain-containing protein n=1 Tax=Stenotrophomonas lacuserhaii TaxID=2760084 RepID=A0A8X8FP80_9GAMM|nr:hypothetical protein [Stenotrophomonas pennii]MBD7954052.1 hypothetical protein [Stenotrophomonas pennii]